MPFDAAAHLKDEETIRAYLRAALDDPTPGALLLALAHVSQALQMRPVGLSPLR
ncbi:hypothetical protein SA496_00140 [Pseudomonas sp. JS3066]|uniref:helix-turn-helix domain-containing transcriptional regulator n=1 Tax=Pseudomonas sp. JS3066 TaxID=3090665 RepID=UPI002E7C342C|nr:hypothetical protein [Pseudomonas sp. JS3066]WVK96418.1 hypothetical protein SA496_00050 [Pseudomonas sp. JS3066]WVK96419.1 hypothetical protein SA496_00140 [Pseudomonas sp. JS3066]